MSVKIKQAITLATAAIAARQRGANVLVLSSEFADAVGQEIVRRGVTPVGTVEGGGIVIIADDMLHRFTFLWTSLDTMHILGYSMAAKAAEVEKTWDEGSN